MGIKRVRKQLTNKGIVMHLIIFNNNPRIILFIDKHIDA